MKSHQTNEQPDIDILLQVANNQLSQSDFKAAFASYSELLVLSSNKFAKKNIVRALAHIGRGHIHMRSKKDIDAALQSYKQALIIDPNIPEGAVCLSKAYLGCAHASFALKDINNAAQFFMLALLFDTKSSEAKKFFNLFTTHSHPLFLQAKTLMTDPDSLEVMMACSQFFFQQHKLDNALYFVNKSLEMNPKWNDALILLTKIYVAQKKLEYAIIACNEMLKHNPKDAIAYCNRGIIYHRLNKLDEAIVDYNHAFALNPDEIKIQIYCVFAYLDKKDYEAVAENIFKIKNFEFIDMNVVTDFKKYVDVLYHLGNKKFTDAVFDTAAKIFQFILKFDPQHKEAQEGLKKIVESCVTKGIYQLGINHFTRALIYLNLALELDTKNETAYHYRGMTHFKINQFRESIFDFNCALDLNYHRKECHYFIGLAYHAIKKFKQAIPHLTQSLSLDTHFTEARLALNNAKGMCLLQDNTANDENIADNARALFMKTLRKDPENANAKLGMQHAYLHSAEHHYTLNEFDRAKCSYNQALLIDSNCKEAYLGLRNISLKEGDWRMARLYFVKSTESKTSDLQSHSVFSNQNAIASVSDFKNITPVKTSHKGRNP